MCAYAPPPQPRASRLAGGGSVPVRARGPCAAHVAAFAGTSGRGGSEMVSKLF